ncbi:MAG: Uma2 family endonuclease [Bacteroidota bacterium]
MQPDLLTQLLDHPTPERVWQQAAATLAEQRKARLAFREWLKPDVKAEFINGEIIMHSPAKRRHNQATHCINTLLGLYTSVNTLGEVTVEKALVELERSDVEPDVCFWYKEKAASFTDEMNVYPPPDLVVEVLSKSTQGRDRGEKKDAYEADGVREYWIVDPKARTLELYELAKNKHGKMVFHLRDTFGVEQSFTSLLLPGFTVPLRAFFEPEARDKAVRELLEG